LINQLSYVITHETDPYKNLALEEYLLHRVGPTEAILYLWQNERTIVIGRNQNPWKECKVQELEEDGGKLVRRLSGGGAVFHDLGNLNFTFLVARENYDLEKQLEVILRAVKQLGIPAVKSGRNDITADDRKFSGNAFYSDGIHSYHHGTILIRVDMSKLSHYLNVSREKLQSKGVDSVRSRVCNLSEYVPDLTISGMREELIKAFSKVYGLTAEPMKQESMDQEELKKLEEKFSSWEWNFGRKLAFSDSMVKRFSWGEVELQFAVESGIIRQCAVYSDALESELFTELAGKLTGCPFRGTAMTEALNSLTGTDKESREEILGDIIALIRNEGI
jgi:lipoate-protein ligase A